MAVDNSSKQRLDPIDLPALSFTAFSQPTRQGVHWTAAFILEKAQLFNAAPFALSRSDSTTTEGGPMNDPMRLPNVIKVRVGCIHRAGSSPDDGPPAGGLEPMPVGPLPPAAFDSHP